MVGSTCTRFQLTPLHTRAPDPHCTVAASLTLNVQAVRKATREHQDRAAAHETEMRALRSELALAKESESRAAELSEKLLSQAADLKHSSAGMHPRCACLCACVCVCEYVHACACVAISITMPYERWPCMPLCVHSASFCVPLLTPTCLCRERDEWLRPHPAGVFTRHAGGAIRGGPGPE